MKIASSEESPNGWFDANNELSKVWPRDDETSFAYLRFIDWYGDATFNSLQMESFLEE